jgi:hypothetical protein
VRLDAVISPYHLTTREAPAIAAMLLCESAVTYMPVPFGGASPSALERAVERVPGYRMLMDSWAWAEALWRGGVISSEYEGDDPGAYIRGACERLLTEPNLAPLRALMREELLISEEAYLNAVSHDLLRAGPDPGVSVPVVAGLDEFALAHDLVSIRPEPVSLAQKAERSLATKIATVAAPVLVQGEGESLMQVRELLEAPLEGVRGAIGRVVRAGLGGDEQQIAEATGGLTEAMSEFSGAFAAERESIAHIPEEDEARLIESQVALTIATLPRDAALAASVAAHASLSKPREPTDPRELCGPERIAVLFVKPLGSSAVRSGARGGRRGASSSARSRTWEV